MGVHPESKWFLGSGTSRWDKVAVTTADLTHSCSGGAKRSPKTHPETLVITGNIDKTK